MKVELIYYTPLSIMATAGRTAWKSFHNGGVYDSPTNNITQKDKDFLDRIVNKYKHESVAEHINYNFSINGISRGCLQELVRHRHASLTVQSTRYVLGKLKNEEKFNDFDNELDYKRAEKYIVFTGKRDIDIISFFMLEDLRDNSHSNISNDYLKYNLPECYKTSLVWSVNARSLKNFIKLRTDKSAHWEIRDLAYLIYNTIPESHKFIFDDAVYLA